MNFAVIWNHHDLNRSLAVHCQGDLIDKVAETKSLFTIQRERSRACAGPSPNRDTGMRSTRECPSCKGARSNSSQRRSSAFKVSVVKSTVPIAMQTYNAPGELADASADLNTRSQCLSFSRCINKATLKISYSANQLLFTYRKISLPSKYPLVSTF